MCGIVGAWFSGRRIEGGGLIRAALEELRHRGPDDRGSERYDVGVGELYFGHARLSIIDLSNAGHQPMSSPDRRYSIVFNGEIYNYPELKTELASLGCTFVSESDTEVLLSAWAMWGESILHRLIGMFAFVVFDRVRETITCVRDPFGIKPFFYSTSAGKFVFASEIGAVRKLLGSKQVLDWQQAYNYLVMADYDSGERTFFRDVKHLLPGHILTLSLSATQVSIRRWWSPSIAESWNGDFLDAAEVLREMFLRSIRLHMRSDVPLGAALSGGLDSSSVVCAMRHLEPDATINTFSFIADDSPISEEVWVDQVNSHIRARAFKVKVTGEELARDLDDMIRVQGEPFGSTSIYAQYRVFRLASECGVTVTLDGQGADELLGGYQGYPGARMHSLLDRRQYFNTLAFLNNWSRWPGRTRRGGVARLINELTDGDVNAKLRRLSGYREFPEWLDVHQLREAGVKGLRLGDRGTEEEDVCGRRMMSALRISLTRKGLPSLLRHADRNSMRFSVESRVPFLTYEMAEFLLSLPEEYLVSQDGETKSVFRAAMRGIVPDKVLDRRDKIGFSTPEQVWLFGMADTVRSWLVTESPIPFIDQRRIIEEFDLIVSGKKKFSWQVWRWVNFIRWHAVSFNS